MDALLAHKTWRSAEPIHALIYFVDEAREEYEKLGMSAPRMGYFASRAAALGSASAELVIATFYNFNPELVRRSIPAAWDIASPADVLAARQRAADRSLRRAFGEIVATSAVRRAANLAQRAAEGAMSRLEGRPLFAAHANLEWPDEAHLVLWHAQTLLREFRGDGHIMALLDAELDPVEALVTHEATKVLPAGVLLDSRAWPPSEWAAACERLAERGILQSADDVTLTPHGTELRRHIEQRTDELSVPPYRLLGDDGCHELRSLTKPLSRLIVDGGFLGGFIPSES
ncbi:MAG: hypothetical protein WCG86_03065 [Actinomycetota bacterium]